MVHLWCNRVTCWLKHQSTLSILFFYSESVSSGAALHFCPSPQIFCTCSALCWCKQTLVIPGWVEIYFPVVFIPVDFVVQRFAVVTSLQVIGSLQDLSTFFCSRDIKQPWLTRCETGTHFPLFPLSSNFLFEYLPLTSLVFCSAQTAPA